MGYTKDVVKGFGWIGLFRMGAKALIFFKVLVAYRYLSPSEVGLFGLAAIALGLLEMLTETGINVIIVRDKRPTEYFLNTAFVISLVRGVAISALLFASSFVLPAFFREERLQLLLLWVTVIPLIKAFINPAIISFYKSMQYHKEALLRLSLVVIEVVSALALVYRYQSALSLIWSMIIVAVIEVLISYIFIHPWPKLQFSSRVYKDIVSPGKWVNLAGIFVFAEQNLDNVLIGRMFGSTNLGYYQTAFNLGRSGITELGTSVSQVLLPIYGRISGDDLRLRKAVRKTIIPVGLILLVPLILINLPLTQEYMITLLKEKWRPMLSLLPYLSVAAWLSGMNILFNPLFVVKDHIKQQTYVFAFGLLVMLFCVYYGASQAGLLGAAQGLLISRLIMQPIFIVLAYRALGSIQQK